MIQLKPIDSEVQKTLIEKIKQSGKKASEFLRPFKMTPYKIKNIQNVSKKVLEIPHIRNAINSLKLKLSNKGRILVRPSGTEPLVRVLVESKDENLIDKYINFIKKAQRIRNGVDFEFGRYGMTKTIAESKLYYEFLKVIFKNVR